MEFADHTAYDAYNAHPDHVRFVETAGCPRSRTSSRSTTPRARMTSERGRLFAGVARSTTASGPATRRRSSTPPARSLAWAEARRPRDRLRHRQARPSCSSPTRCTSRRSIPARGMIDVARGRVGSRRGRRPSGSRPLPGRRAAGGCIRRGVLGDSLPLGRSGGRLGRRSPTCSAPAATFALLTYTRLLAAGRADPRGLDGRAARVARVGAARPRSTVFDGMEARLGNVSDGVGMARSARGAGPARGRGAASDDAADDRRPARSRRRPRASSPSCARPRPTSRSDRDDRRRVEDGLTAAVEGVGGSYPTGTSSTCSSRAAAAG